MSRPPMMVITLPQAEHQFLQELMTRVTREGLLVPDELPYAASLWTRIRQAQPVEIPEVPTEPVGRPATGESSAADLPSGPGGGGGTGRPVGPVIYGGGAGPLSDAEMTEREDLSKETPHD